jgi:hypothetical protein
VLMEEAGSVTGKGVFTACRIVKDSTRNMGM